MSRRMLIPSFRARIRAAQDYLPGWLNPDEEIVGKMQFEKVKMIWSDAVKNVPYYKRLVESGQAPKTIESLDQFLSEVPLLDKKTLQKNHQEFVRLDLPPDMTRATGGSTGEPFRFGVFKSELEEGAPMAMVGRLAHGMNLASDRVFLLVAHTQLLGTGWRGKKNHLKRRILDFILQYKRCDAHRLDKINADKIFRQLFKFRPKVVYGYSSAIDTFVRANLEHGDLAASLGCKLVICTAEPFPRNDSKSLIESFFQARVIMEYGAVDLGTVAYEKPQGGYGVFWWGQLVEIDASESPGDSHRQLVLTSLYPRYLPLIRYCSGDSISGWDFSGTARGITKFDSLEGRVNDYVAVGDDLIYAMGFGHCVRDEANILGMQLILEPESVRLVLVGNRDLDAENRIRRRLADLSPNLRNCRIEYAEDLHTTMAGKRRWVIDRRHFAA